MHAYRNILYFTSNRSVVYKQLKIRAADFPKHIETLLKAINKKSKTRYRRRV